MDFFEMVKEYLSKNYELISLFTAIFFAFVLFGTLKEQHWIYNNPIAVKSGINKLPFKVQKFIWIIFGAFWFVLSSYITVYLYLKK